jgi:glycosyltransferase involved in cell wall biosynthesis
MTDTRSIAGLVSVVIPAYNAGTYLRASVESILRQRYDNLEVILIDDGSTDGSIETLSDVNDERLRIYRQANAGKPAALNRALSLIRGEFYALQDADDISHPDRIGRQVAALQAAPSVAGVFCGYQVLLHDRPYAPHFRTKETDDCRKHIDRFQMPGHDPTAMYRWQMVSDLPYDESLPVVEGYDYILRVGERLPLMLLGDCLYGYRIHPDTVTKRDPARREALLAQAKRKACERRGISQVPGHASRKRATGNRMRDNDQVSIFMESIADLRYAGRHVAAAKNAFRCCLTQPLDPYYFKPLLASLMPFALYCRLRREAAPAILPSSYQQTWAPLVARSRHQPELFPVLNTINRT